MCHSQDPTFSFAIWFSPPLLVGYNVTCKSAIRCTCTSKMTPLIVKDLCLIVKKILQALKRAPCLGYNSSHHGILSFLRQCVPQGKR